MIEKIYTISYDCDCVGEHYSDMGDVFFLTKEEAWRYIRENLVDNRQGQGYAEHQFSVNELTLQKIDMKKKEKQNWKMYAK